MIEAALRHKIITTPAVNAIIGSRMHADTDPQQSPRPKVTYVRINTNRGLSNDGPTNAPVAQFRLDCWADTAQGAAGLSDVVREAIDGFRGSVTVGTGPDARTWIIDGIHVRDQYANNATGQPGAEKPPQRYSLSVTVNFKD